VEIRIDGPALLSAMHYEVPTRRGAACGQIVTAGLPEDAGEEQDSARARAVRAVSRSSLGVPGYRLPGSQAMGGGPVAAATPWDQSEQGGDCASGGLAPRAKAAAQGALILQDDTAVRLLSLREEPLGILSAAQAPGVSTPQARPGMPPTAWAGKGGEHTALLYDASRRHARAKTSRGCWRNGRRVSHNRWRCRTRCRAMQWPMKRR
jgi:hypothetical protein